MSAIEVIFWSCLGFCAYVYFGYPLLLALVGLVRRREVCKAPCFPSVSVIIAAFNEEQTIAEKLENTLSLDYPKDRL